VRQSRFAGSTRIAAGVLIVSTLTAVSLLAGDIHTAAVAGDLNKVRALLESDPTLLESKDSGGSTPLLTACAAQRVAVANFLLEKGANVKARDGFQMTPLHRASYSYTQSQDLALIQRFIDMGADVNAQGYNGLIPLHQAAQSGGLAVARLLMDRGANVNAFDKYTGAMGTAGISGTVLQVAINFNPKEEMAMFLVGRGAKLNRRDSSGNTELHLAALKGYVELARALAGHGADIDAVNQYDRTALYYAAKHGYRRVADALLAAGAKKSAIVETNYGKAPQLAAALQEGEAYLWFLGDGFAVKTKGHLILFNPGGIDDSLEAGLANGHINPNELAGMKITVLATASERFQYGPDAFRLAQRMPGVELVFGVKPFACSGVTPDPSSYRLASPNEHFSVGGLRVHTIPATGGGMGYLVEADGVKIFNAGFHVSDNNPSNLARYRKEIDFLKPFGPVDAAIVSVHSHSNSIGADNESHLYLLDELSPQAVYLLGANQPDQYPKCAEVLRSRGIPVNYPEGGRSKGERFHFIRKRKKG